MEGNTHFGGNSQFKTGHHSLLFNEHIASKMSSSRDDHEYLSNPLAYWNVYNLFLFWFVCLFVFVFVFF